MLLAVFAATARPYLDRLDAWVSRGELEDDVAGELFIFSGERGYPLCGNPGQTHCPQPLQGQQLSGQSSSLGLL